jgi:hypothetical protein
MSVKVEWVNKLCYNLFIHRILHSNERKNCYTHNKGEFHRNKVGKKPDPEVFFYFTHMRFKKQQN